MLYPSDYGYSASSSYWSSSTLYNWTTTQSNTSWLISSTNSITNEWFLSAAANYSYNSSYIYDNSRLASSSVNSPADGLYGARPVLNLLESAPIDTNHQGTEADPYIILE